MTIGWVGVSCSQVASWASNGRHSTLPASLHHSPRHHPRHQVALAVLPEQAVELAVVLAVAAAGAVMVVVDARLRCVLKAWLRALFTEMAAVDAACAQSSRGTTVG